MRYTQIVFLALFIWLVPNAVFAQLSDDFSDGDFTTNPAWVGETTKFEVDVNQKLHLNAPAESDTAYLSTPSQSIDDASWEFLVELDFNPSASNVARVYLASNNDNLRASLNGYYVRIGGETQDRISLYRQDGLSSDQLITSADGLVSTDPVNARIRVTRTASSDWELLADTAGGTTFASIGTVNDATYFQSFHVGVHCKYTSTRSDKFYFDDFTINGNPFVDADAPQVLSVTVTSINEVDVLFNEPVDQATAETLTNYTADGGLNLPSGASLDGGNPSLVHLTFSSAFLNGITYNLTVSNVEDLSANALVTTIEPFTYVESSVAGFRDVVINEFMCDPTPFVGLPEAEFVELFNSSSNYIDLTGWKIGDASSTGTIGSHIIGPSEYALLISASDTIPFAFFDNVVVVSSFPSLNNSGDDIVLLDTGENTIDQLSYDLSWYQDPNKEDGGYSIEQINPFASCTNPNNWRGSDHVLGGTPSAENSVFDSSPDVTGPTLSGVTIISSTELELGLNEALDAGTVSGTSISINPLTGVNSAVALAPTNQNISVILSAPIDTGVVYTVTITGINDCEGNLQSGDSTATFILPF